MWFVLRPLIFYLESLVFRYIPLARGDVWEKRWGAGILAASAKKHIYGGGSFLVSWRFLEEGGGQLLSGSTSAAFFYYGGTRSSFFCLSSDATVLYPF